MLAGVLAEREGKPADDLSSRVIAGAIIGVILAIVPPGTTDGFEAPEFDRLYEALNILRDGLHPR
jgi:hypothetical protein